MIFNDAGKIADEYLKNIPEKYKQTQLHEYVVMPNHIHVIVEITESSVGAIDESPNNDSPHTKPTIPGAIHDPPTIGSRYNKPGQ
ncbi:MAG: hypothetical protein IPP29_16665 [Bacteroidetes bacterium]|nr:hypothetical protein [Bacteroidota bacterium]